MPQLPNSPSLFRKLLGIRPSQFGEFLDGDPAAVLKAALVDNIGGSVAALGDDGVEAEVVGGGLQVGERELGEGGGAGGIGGGRRRVAERRGWGQLVVV